MKYFIPCKKPFNIILKRNLVPFVMNTIIAPHGITDISHSLETNNLKKLININLFSYFFTEIYSHINLDIVSDYIFIFLSIIHFREDFLIFEKKILISTLFIIFLSIINNYISSLFAINIFLFYMSFFHVPSHYKQNFWHIKKNLFLNLLLIFSTYIISDFIYTYSLIKHKSIYNIIKSVIISHIIYTEKINSKKDNH